MSTFKESDEYDPKYFVPTQFGFALEQPEMPRRKDVLWKQKSSGDVFYFDDDEWRKMAEKPRLPEGGLNHG